MNKNLITAGILFLVLVVFSLLLVGKEPMEVATQEVSDNVTHKSDEVATTSSGIILFFGDGCPHCAIVEEYVKENKVKDIISFEEKEVYYNKINSKQLTEKAKGCGMPTDSIGVPFLWTGETCLVGDQDIIEFFKSKTNQQ